MYNILLLPSVCVLNSSSNPYILPAALWFFGSDRREAGLTGSGLETLSLSLSLPWKTLILTCNVGKTFIFLYACWSLSAYTIGQVTFGNSLNNLMTSFCVLLCVLHANLVRGLWEDLKENGFFFLLGNAALHTRNTWNGDLCKVL